MSRQKKDMPMILTRPGINNNLKGESVRSLIAIKLRSTFALIPGREKST